MTSLNSAKIKKVRAHDSFLICFAKYSNFRRPDRSHMSAARQGLEPRYLGPKPSVLPLDDRAIYVVFNALYFALFVKKNQENNPLI